MTVECKSFDFADKNQIEMTEIERELNRKIA